MLCFYPAIAIDQKGDRQTQNSAVFFSDLCIAHYDGIVHVKLPVEGECRVRTIVHGHADNLKTSAAIFLLQFDEMWRFDAARLTPAGPKIEKYHFAAIGRKAK